MRQELLKNKKRGFVKICSVNEAYVKVKWQCGNVAFNKSTIYPNLYISANRRTTSNKQFALFSKKKAKSNFFQDIMRFNHGGLQGMHKSVTMITWLRLQMFRHATEVFKNIFFCKFLKYKSWSQYLFLIYIITLIVNAYAHILKT